MISIARLFAVREQPYRRSRFILFMLGLVALAAFSLGSEIRSVERQTVVAGKTATLGPAVIGEATIVRFPQPMDDTLGDLRQIGLPWFLRRQGATATLYSTGDAAIAVAVTYQSKVIGTFSERLEALGEDRSKLLVAFFPADAELLHRLVAPIDTKLDPSTLMRVVMAEHIRASINGGGFDMNVLTDQPGSRASVFRRAFHDSGLCQDPQVDNFAECSQERENANVRRAYREEAAR